MGLIALLALSGGCRQAAPGPARDQQAARDRGRHAASARQASTPDPSSTAPPGRPLNDTEAIEAVRALPEVRDLIATYGDEAGRHVGIEVTDRHEHVFTVQVTETASGGAPRTHGMYEVDRETGEVIKVEP